MFHLSFLTLRGSFNEYASLIDWLGYAVDHNTCWLKNRRCTLAVLNQLFFPKDARTCSWIIVLLPPFNLTLKIVFLIKMLTLFTLSCVNLRWFVDKLEVLTEKSCQSLWCCYSLLYVVMAQDMMQGLWNVSHALCHMSSGYIPCVFVQVIGPSASNINSNIWQYNTSVKHTEYV